MLRWINEIPITRQSPTGLIRAYKAVVGTRRWPTPKGLFAVSERVPQPDPAGFLGPWALLLTAFRRP